MSKLLNGLLALNLQLFAEGGGGEGGTGAMGSSTGETASVPGLQGAKATNNGGMQTANASTEVGTVTPDRNAEFEALIKGEYKDLYDARVQDTIKQRLKGQKDIVDKYNALSPTLELLGRKYGVDSADAVALNKAIEEDDAYYEDEALERGISVEQLKDIRKMERENSELKKQIQEQESRKQAEKDVAEWMKQAESASKQFPSLNLGEELKNPQFVNLLKNNIDVGTAYFAIHHDVLVPQAMQYSVKQAEEKVAKKVIANGLRPNENGSYSQAPAHFSNDVSHMTKEERDYYISRARQGERITFR